MLTTVYTKLLVDKEVSTRLELLLKRDTSVIKRVLGILNYNENKLYQKRKSGKKIKYKTRRSTLYKYMLSTSSNGSPPYDLKKEFPRISHNELAECIDTANTMYLSYLSMRHNKKASVPSVKDGELIPRYIGKRRISIDTDHSVVSLMDSYDTNLKIVSGKQSRVRHNRLRIKYAPYHRLNTHLKEGEVKSASIIKKNGYYEIHFRIDIYTSPICRDVTKPKAILGIDLGISKTATTSLLTSSGISRTKIFHNCGQGKKLRHYEGKISFHQHAMALKNKQRYLKVLQFYKKRINTKTISQSLDQITQKLNRNEPLLYEIVKCITILSMEHKDEKKLSEYLYQLMENYDDFDDYSTHSKYLRRYRRKLANLKSSATYQICNQISNYIVELNKDFDLYISMGKIQNLRRKNRRGSGNRSLRKKIHKWPYRQLSDKITYNLNKVGLETRLIEVQEAYTSIKCWKCNKKGSRPKQETFYCNNYHCEINKINSDINAATNIAKRSLGYFDITL